MSGPYGAPPYKRPPARQSRGGLHLNRPIHAACDVDTLPDEELNDTEWPLEKTLTIPRSYTTLNR